MHGCIVTESFAQCAPWISFCEKRVVLSEIDCETYCSFWERLFSIGQIVLVAIVPQTDVLTEILTLSKAHQLTQLENWIFQVPDVCLLLFLSLG